MVFFSENVRRTLRSLIQCLRKRRREILPSYIIFRGEQTLSAAVKFNNKPLIARAPWRKEALDRAGGRLLGERIVFADAVKM